MQVRRLVQDLAFSHLAAFPTLEVCEKVREESHGHVRIHERNAERLREDEQIYRIVVPDPHLHVLRVKVEEEETPEDFLQDLPCAPSPAHAVPRRMDSSARVSIFPMGPRALGGSPASVLPWPRSTCVPRRASWGRAFSSAGTMPRSPLPAA